MKQPTTTKNKNEKQLICCAKSGTIFHSHEHEVADETYFREIFLGVQNPVPQVEEEIGVLEALSVVCSVPTSHLVAMDVADRRDSSAPPLDDTHGDSTPLD